MKQRLDRSLVERGLIVTRSQAESFIRMGSVLVNKNPVTKSGYMVGEQDVVTLTAKEQYVSRAGLKLASIAQTFKLNFKDTTVLDVGSSTGGFTDYALRHGAAKVIAVDVGTNQLHPSLRQNPKVELHEQTDIRDIKSLSQPADYVVIDVSFISLRDVLPHIARLVGQQTKIIAMVKPQFEAGNSQLKHKGVIKNEKVRRDILKDFESWSMQHFKISNKADSQVSGEKGNKERFYVLLKLKK
ncbi:MAG: TlyA family RNA methyltransferase [Candidatus Saccharimonadales bacterium]